MLDCRFCSFQGPKGLPGAPGLPGEPGLMGERVSGIFLEGLGPLRKVCTTGWFHTVSSTSEKKTYVHTQLRCWEYLQAANF